MENRTVTRRLNTAMIILFLFIIPIRYIDYQSDGMTCNAIICILFTIIAFIWIYQIRRRVIHKAVRRFLVGIAVLNLSLIVMRTIKYIFVLEESMLARNIWYLYYVPMILSVLFMFYATLYVGESYYRKISSRWKLLLIPAVFLCLIIMTNDLHQLVFSFNYGLEGWSDAEGKYRKEIFFYIIMGWIIILITGTLLNVIRKCIVPENRKKIWMPLLPFLCGMILLLINPEDSLIKMPEIHCMIYPSIMESMIIAGLIPSNQKYPEIWNLSSICFGLMSKDEAIDMKNDAYSVSPDKVLSALNKNQYIMDNDHEIKSREIAGGYGFWIRDISEINNLKNKIREYGDILKEENVMLKAEQEMETEKIKIREQNRIYNSIINNVYWELSEINKILEEDTEDGNTFCRKIIYAAIMNVYIKRYSNMILTGKDGILPAEELRFAVTESLEYISLYGVKVHGEYHLSGMFPSETITFFYNFFQTIVEIYFNKIKGMMVFFHSEDNILKLHIETDGRITEEERSFLIGKAVEQNRSLTIENDDDTIYLTLIDRK